MGTLDGETTGRQMADRAGSARARAGRVRVMTLSAGVAGVWVGGDEVGRLKRERHQSPRTNATGWRWFPYLHTGRVARARIGPPHGFETRREAADFLISALP